MSYYCKLGCVNQAGKPAIHVRHADCPKEAKGQSPPSPIPPASGVGTPEVPPVVPQAAPGPMTGSQGRRKFEFLRRKADRITSESAPIVAEDYELSGEVVTRFWKGVFGLITDVVHFIDDSLAYPRMEDLKLRPAEEDLVSDLLPGPTTKLMKALGFKTKEDAESFIDGFSVVTAFGMIFMRLGGHFFALGMELKRRRENNLTWTGKPRPEGAPRKERRPLWGRPKREPDTTLTPEAGAVPVVPVHARKSFAEIMREARARRSETRPAREGEATPG